MEIYVEAVISPLANFLDYEVDRESRTIRTSSFFGLVEAEAAHRRGCGCTQLHDTSADELRAAFTPETHGPADLAWEIDADYRRQLFDEAGLDRAMDEAFAEPEGGGRNTLAVLALYDGRLVAERYAPAIDATTPLTGWSMTKSVTATLVGILVRDGRLDVGAPAGFPEWSTDDDPRRPITLDLLLRMTAGLDIIEDQSGDDPNTVMLHMQPDGAGYSASRSLYTEPNTDFSYMSGCTVRGALRPVGDDHRRARARRVRHLYRVIVHARLGARLGAIRSALSPARRLAGKAHRDRRLDRLRHDPDHALTPSAVRRRLLAEPRSGHLARPSS